MIFHRSSRDSLSVLELNAMFDSNQERRKRRSRSRRKETARRSTWETGSRRSSMSVMALTAKKTEKRKRKFFPRCDQMTPQSRTAVHYLAISPPRIRITDTSRDNSPGAQHSEFLTVSDSNRLDPGQWAVFITSLLFIISAQAARKSYLQPRPVERKD